MPSLLTCSIVEARSRRIEGEARAYRTPLNARAFREKGSEPLGAAALPRQMKSGVLRRLGQVLID